MNWQKCTKQTDKSTLDNISGSYSFAVYQYHKKMVLFDGYS